MDVEPRIVPLGDCYVGVVFGEGASIALNAQVLGLKHAIEEIGPPGIVEFQETSRQLGIVLDRRLTNYETMKEVVTEAFERLDDEAQLISRLIDIPVWFQDPWTRIVAGQYGMGDNVEFVAEANGLTVEEVISRLTTTDFWVTIVAFTPGTVLTYPFDRSKTLTAPKYERPRTFTPSRTIGVAGVGTCIYSIASPGGYQMMGRAAVDIYQPEPRIPIFGKDGVLLRVGDRVRYRSVDALEYDEIRDQLTRGTYEFRVSEDEFLIAEIPKLEVGLEEVGAAR